jgi:hypothetical protein
MGGQSRPANPTSMMTAQRFPPLRHGISLIVYLPTYLVKLLVGAQLLLLLVQLRQALVDVRHHLGSTS